MKKFFTLISIVGLFNALPAFSQTGNFATVNLTSATSGATILSAPGAGRQEIALSNDFITGVDRITVNDNGLGEGLIFAPGEVDISMPNSADDGFAGFMFRTNSANPFFFHSPGDATLNINATPGGANLFNANINFGINRTPSYSIRYNNAPNNTGQRLNLVNSTTGKGLHIGAEDTWMDKSLQIRTEAAAMGVASQEILFQTGSIGSNPVLNAMIYHSAFPNFGTNQFHLVKDNGYGIHIGVSEIHFGFGPSTSRVYETFNFPGAMKTSRLLVGGFDAASASRFPTDPTFLLAVDGKVISTEAWCALKTRWPDYVFDKDYDLISLEEVNAFVKKNQHLPGIPTAREVSEKGLDMGEMHTAMLKKVEELTLYLIDMNERVKNLEERNKKMKSQIKGSN